VGHNSFWSVLDGIYVFGEGKYNKYIHIKHRNITTYKYEDSSRSKRRGRNIFT